MREGSRGKSGWQKVCCFCIEVLTYRAAISACGMRVQRHQVDLGSITFNAAISACEKVSDWETTLHSCFRYCNQRLREDRWKWTR